MKQPLYIAGLILIASIAAARQPEVRVPVYVSGDSGAPSTVEATARTTASWIYARIGVRLEWHDGMAPRDGFAIQVRYSTTPGAASPGALAYALPFDDQTHTIVVLYGRLQSVVGVPSREGVLLAHVLAHEIAHILQRTTAHASAGIMKAHWTSEDYGAMARHPLEFTADDVDLIRSGMAAR